MINTAPWFWFLLWCHDGPKSFWVSWKRNWPLIAWQIFHHQWKLVLRECYQRMWIYPQFLKHCPLIRMLGSVYDFPGASWCISSGICYADCLAKVGAGLCDLISTILHVNFSVFKAQSSANRKSLMVSVSTLVLAWSLLSLKMDPPIWYLMQIPTLPFAKAPVIIAENIRLNSVGAETQPFFTPLKTRKCSDVFPSSWSVATIPSCRSQTIVMK